MKYRVTVPIALVVLVMLVTPGVAAQDSPDFGVEIDSTGSPVLEDGKLSVNATVENQANSSAGTQQIVLRDTGFANITRDTTSVSLDGGESQSITLSWDITDSVGEGNVTVSIENGTDAERISIVPREAEDLSISADPSEANSTSVHNWTFSDVPAFDPAFGDEVDGISVDYPDGTSLDGLNETNITVVLTRMLGGGPDASRIDINTDEYSGSSATFDLSGFFTTDIAGEGYVEIRGIQNPPKGDYNATIEFIGEERGQAVSSVADLGISDSGGGKDDFEVTVDRTNSPVTEGETLTVDVAVENTGDESDTQTVSLTVGGTVRDTTMITLSGGSSTTKTIEWTTNEGDAGSYTAEVSTENDTATTGVTVNPDNTAPIAAFEFTPTNPTTSDTVTFDGTGSSDRDGTITSYDWDFGDGTVARGGDVSHSYRSTGTFTVELTVTDDEGATNTTTQTVDVQPEILFPSPIPGTGFETPPKNIPPSEGGFDDNLYEDLDGDGDATNVSPTVRVFGELIRGNDLGLTDEQARALNWNSGSPETEVTPADMVSLFGEQIRA